MVRLSIFMAMSLVLCLGARADEVRYLDRGDVALSQLYEEIRQTKPGDTIDLSYYIWEECSAVTKVVVAELAKKARQGVKIRLLLDGTDQPSKVQATYSEYLRRLGIDVRYFNDVSVLLPSSYQIRNHAKMAVFNGKSVISGGRNIADDYFGLDTDINWVDREVFARGASAEQARQGFDILWNTRGTKTVTGGTDKDIASLEEKCDGWVDNDSKKLKNFLAENAQLLLKNAPVFQCSDVSMEVDNPHFLDQDPDQESHPEYMTPERMRQKAATKAIYELTESARQSLWIENYSYLPTNTYSEILERKQKQNTEVVVLTNDFRGSTEPVAAGTRRYIKRDNGKGKQVVLGLSEFGKLSGRWELTPKKAKFMIHAKVFVADKRDVAVSSVNVDGRSEHYNMESAFIVHNCPAFAREVTQKSIALVHDWEEDKKAGLNERPAVKNWLEPFYRIFEDFL